MAILTPTATPLSARRHMWRGALPWLLLAPSLALLVGFTFGPIIEVITTSLRDADGRANGLANYAALLADPAFQGAVKNTALYGAATILPSIALAFVLALALRRTTLFTTLLRAVFFFPTLIPLVAAASIFLFIFIPRVGLADHYLMQLGLRGPNWLGNPDVVLYSLAVLTVWKNAGYFMIFFIAGLMSLPDDVYESARMDGADKLRQIADITIPLLRPTFSFVFVIAVTHVLVDVDHIFVLTKGGPSGSSNLVLFYIYQQAVENFDIGRASAATVVAVLALLALSVVGMKSLEHRMHTEG